MRVQELYLARLSMAVQDREDAFVRDRVIEDTLESLLAKESQTSVEYEAFAERLAEQDRAVQEVRARAV
jgi:hypothetical protein